MTKEKLESIFYVSYIFGSKVKKTLQEIFRWQYTHEYYYRDAILIFSMNKGIKTLNIHTSIPFSDSSNEVNNLESTPYVKMSKFNLKNTTFKGYKGNDLESLGSNLESSQFVESKKNTKCSKAKTVHC